MDLPLRGRGCRPLRQAGCQYCSASSLLLPLLPKKGGEGRGEEAVFHQFPLSPALSPLVPRGERGKNALRVFMPNTTGWTPALRMKLDLNCDLGEGEPLRRTRALMRWISSANVACGGHAGDFTTMESCVRLAKQQGVRLGAHPGPWSRR